MVKNYTDCRSKIFEAPTGTRSEHLIGCHITAVGKRRDGGMRYWCLTHKADATAKYGRPASTCRAAHIPPISLEETLTLNIDEHPGGIALWGAVPPIYDTTQLPLDRGIHVHARKTGGEEKVIDRTFRAIKLTGAQLPSDGLVVSEIDAIYYMVSTIFGFEVQNVICSLCGYPHLDKDWFAVHPHRRHLCAGCGMHFRNSRVAIGNPVRRVQDACRIAARKPKKAKKSLCIRQKDYPGGIQIWGSNAAILWSAEKDEEEGIHIHAFGRDGAKPIHDDTFAQVTIDGVQLDPAMVRTLMAQTALPHIEGRVVSLNCAECGSSEFGVGEDAFTPAERRRCSKCGGCLRRRGKLRKIIGNPVIALLDGLALNALRPPQQHMLGLLPETL